MLTSTRKLGLSSTKKLVLSSGTVVLQEALLDFAKMGEDGLRWKKGEGAPGTKTSAISYAHAPLPPTNTLGYLLQTRPCSLSAMAYR